MRSIQRPSFALEHPSPAYPQSPAIRSIRSIYRVGRALYDAYHDANRIIGRFAHELLVLNRVGRTHQPSVSIDDDAATAA